MLINQCSRKKKHIMVVSADGQKKRVFDLWELREQK